MDIAPPKALKLSQLCRLCLSDDGLMVHIYGEERTGFTVPLRDRIMTCASVEVQEEDGLPALVCHRCLFHVDLLFEFKERCKRADKALRCFCDELPRKGETDDISPLSPKESKIGPKKAKSPRKSAKADRDQLTVRIGSNNGQAVTISMKAKTGGAGPSAKPYNCPHCNKPFTYKARLAAHIKTHGEGALYHGDSLHQTQAQQAAHQAPQQPAQQQAQQQSQYDRMQYDMQSYGMQPYPEAPATPATPPSSSSDSSYSCTNCNASFMTPWLLADHVRNHCCDSGAAYSCDKCFMHFSSYSELEQHASTHNCDSQTSYYDAYTPPPSHYGMYMQQQQQQHMQQMQQRQMQQQYQQQQQQQQQQQADYASGDVADSGAGRGSPWDCVAMGGVQRRPDGYDNFSRPTMGSMEELEKFALGSTMVTSPLEPLTSPVPTEPPPSAPSPIDAENSMQSVQSVQSVQSAQSAHSTQSSGSAPGSSSCSVAKLNFGGMVSHNFSNANANAPFSSYGMGSNFAGNFSADPSHNFAGTNPQMFCNNSGNYPGGTNTGFGVGASHNFGGNFANANMMFGGANKSGFGNCPSPGFGNNASYGNANNNYTSNNNAQFAGSASFGNNSNACFGSNFSGNANFEGNASGHFGNSNPNFGVITGGNFSGNSGANPKSATSVSTNFQSNDFGSAYDGNALLDAGSTLKTALGGQKASSCGDVNANVSDNCKREVSTPPDYGTAATGTPTGTPTKSDDLQPYSCHVCRAGFASRTLFTNHMKTHANERPLTAAQLRSQHPTGCDHASLPIKQEAEDDPKKDDEGSDAEGSSQESADDADLDADSSPSKRSKKTDPDGKGERNHECSYCGKGFVSTVRLNNHIKIHTLDKPFKCDQCEKSFRSRAHLQRHAKTHVGEKPFKCETCNKSFTVSMNLKIHVRTHTGERPYSCNLCKMAFIGYSHLYNHLKTHTSDTPFTYTYFNKTYTTAGNFSSAKKDSAVNPNASPMDSELQAELEAGVEDEEAVLD